MTFSNKLKKKQKQKTLSKVFLGLEVLLKIFFFLLWSSTANTEALLPPPPPLYDTL